MRPRPVVGEATVPEAVRRLLDKFDYPDRESPSQVVPILPTLGAGGGIGAFVHLTRSATQSIASGGEALSWDALGVQGVSGFSETVPTTTVTILQTGYYNIAVQLGWSSFTDGGTITILKNGLVVWAPTDDPGLWSTTDGQFFEGTAPAIDCAVGDTLSVNVNPDDASAQTLASATLAVYLVDRAANEGLYRELVISHEPDGYWRLDESAGTNAADETGANDGTYVGAPTLNQTGVMRDGSGSSSVDFDGATEWVTVPQAAVNGFTDLTVEAWINFDAAARYGIFNVNDSGAPDAAALNRWGFWKMASGKLLWSGEDAAGGELYEADTALSVDTDYYVAATRTAAGTLIFYVNGLPDGTHTGINVAASAAGDTVQIGMDIDAGPSNTDFFNGQIDEVAVYGRVLSPVEIADHYEVGRRGA